MKITNDYIASLKPCKDRHDNYLKHYANTSFSKAEFLQLERITYEDKIWVWKQFATSQEAALFGLKCASSVLDIFEAKYPNDKRPRLALEAADAVITDPSDENEEKCRAYVAYTADAAYATYAAYAADAAYATYAAYAAYAAASAVAYANAAAYATYAADAATTATYAADAAATAARAQQKELNLIFLVEIYQEGE